MPKLVEFMMLHAHLKGKTNLSLCSGKTVSNTLS